MYKAGGKQHCSDKTACLCCCCRFAFTKEKGEKNPRNSDSVYLSQRTHPHLPKISIVVDLQLDLTRLIWFIKKTWLKKTLPGEKHKPPQPNIPFAFCVCTQVKVQPQLRRVILLSRITWRWLFLTQHFWCLFSLANFTNLAGKHLHLLQVRIQGTAQKNQILFWSGLHVHGHGGVRS